MMNNGNEWRKTGGHGSDGGGSENFSLFFV